MGHWKLYKLPLVYEHRITIKVHSHITFYITESFLVSCCTTAATALIHQQGQHKSSWAWKQKRYFTRPACLAHPDSRCDVRKVTLFDLQGYYQQIRETLLWCQKSMSLFCCMTKLFAKGECNYIVVFFQLTPGEGIIGNHPCNVVPLNFWQLSETTVLWFRRLDVKSKLNIPSVPQTQRAFPSSVLWKSIMLALHEENLQAQLLPRSTAVNK